MSDDRRVFLALFTFVHGSLSLSLSLSPGPGTRSWRWFFMAVACFYIFCRDSVCKVVLKNVTQDLLDGR